MRNFKLLLVVLAVVCLILTVVACGSSDTTDAPKATEGPKATNAPATQGTPVTNAPATNAPETQAVPATQAPTPTTVPVTEPSHDYTEADVPEDGNISNATQLAAVLTYGKLDADYTLTADIDMTGISYKGLGGTEEGIDGTTTYVGYSGTFDGAGYTIKGLTTPMFRCLQAGTVRDFKIADSAIVAEDDDAYKADAYINGAENYAYAPVVAYAIADAAEKPAQVFDITVESSITIDVSIYTKDSAVAGVVGAANGPIEIKGCVNYGTLSTDSLKIWIGGIVGFVNSSAGGVDTIFVRKCTNYGNIHNKATGENDSKIGGVCAGLLNATCEYCANYGDLISEESNGQTGGVVGYVGNSTAMQYCINGGKITSNGAFDGGICGYSNGSERAFLYCVNYGDVKFFEGTTKIQHAAIVFSKSSEVITSCYWLAGNIEYSGDAAVGVQEVINGSSTVATKATITDCHVCASLDEMIGCCEANANMTGVFALADGKIVFAE